MNKLLILVVEDDPSIRKLITTTLKAHEYRYLSAWTVCNFGGIVSQSRHCAVGFGIARYGWCGDYQKNSRLV